MCTSSSENGPSSSASPAVDLVQLDVAQLVLVELRARHRDRQRAAVDGRQRALLAELAQHPRQRAEVVLVAVRDHDRLDVLARARAGRRSRAARGRCRPSPASGSAGRRRRRRSGRRARRPSCSCRSPPARRGAGRAAWSSRGVLGRVTLDSRPWRSSIARTASRLLVGGLHERQAQRRRRRGRAGSARPSCTSGSPSGTASRRRRAATRRSPRGARARRPSGASRCRRCGWRRGSRRRRPCRACARTSRRRRRRASRPSISCSSSALACLTPSMRSICASSASRSGGMFVPVRAGML